MSAGRRPALAGLALALLAAAPALAGSTTALEPGAGRAAARLAVDAGGAAAVLYPAGGGVRMQPAAPGAPPERVPLPDGAVVEGFAMAATSRPAVLARTGRGCAPLVLESRAGPGRWVEEPVEGPPARAAALAADPAGSVSALAAGCDGDLGLRRRDAAGAWTAEPLGQVAGTDARLALAAGAGGAAVAGWSGRRGGIAVRDAAGGWRPAGLPGGPLSPRDALASVAVALDPAGRSVALVARSPRRPVDPATDDLGHVERSAARLAGTAWLPLDGPGDPLALAGSGQSDALAWSGGAVDLETPAGTARLTLDAVALAVGPGGALAYLPRESPGVVGAGPPPALAVSAPATVRWGARVSLETRLTDGGAPVPGARIRSGADTRVTDPDGRAVFADTITESGDIDLAAADPGPVAPAFARVSVRVSPRDAHLRGRLVQRGSRILVRGRVAGGTALPGGYGRVWLVNLAAGPTGFLPGRGLASAPGRGAFTLRVGHQRGAHYALFFEGRTRALGAPITPHRGPVRRPSRTDRPAG